MNKETKREGKESQCTIYDIVQQFTESSIVVKGIHSEVEARNKVNELNTFYGFGGVSYVLSPRVVETPKMAIPKIGDTMYVPSMTLEQCKRREDLKFVKCIHGGLAHITSVGTDQENKWYVHFRELSAQKEEYSGTFDISSSFHFNTLFRNQGEYKRMYLGKTASLEINLNTISAADAKRTYKDVMDDWDSWK